MLRQTSTVGREPVRSVLHQSALYFCARVNKYIEIRLFLYTSLFKSNKKAQSEQSSQSTKSSPSAVVWIHLEAQVHKIENSCNGKHRERRRLRPDVLLVPGEGAPCQHADQLQEGSGSRVCIGKALLSAQILAPQRSPGPISTPAVRTLRRWPSGAADHQTGCWLH